MTATAVLQKKIAANLGRLAGDWAKKVAPGAAILGGTAGAAALAMRGGQPSAANPLRATGVPPGAASAEVVTPEAVTPEDSKALAAEPGLMDKMKTMGGNAIDAAKGWAGQPGYAGTSLRRGGEAAVVGGTLAAGALLAHVLRKKKQPRRRKLAADVTKAFNQVSKAARTPVGAAIGGTALGLTAAPGLAAGAKALTAPAAPVVEPVAPAPEPTFMDKAKTMAGNAWDATKEWAGKPGITSGVTGMNRGTEAVTGALAAGSLLAYLLRKNKKPVDE